MKGSVLFVAVHMGPYQSIVPLEWEFGPNAIRYLLEGLSKEARQSVGGEYWDMARVETTYGALHQFFRAESVRAVVIGTSDGAPDGNVEERAAQEAKAAGVFVFVVEDFPGNYRHTPDRRLDGLFIEDDLMSGFEPPNDVLRGVQRTRDVRIGGDANLHRIASHARR